MAEKLEALQIMMPANLRTTLSRTHSARALYTMCTGPSQVDTFARKFRSGGYLRTHAGLRVNVQPECYDVLSCPLVVPRHIRMFLESGMGNHISSPAMGPGRPNRVTPDELQHSQQVDISIAQVRGRMLH